MHVDRDDDDALPLRLLPPVRSFGAPDVAAFSGRARPAAPAAAIGVVSSHPRPRLSSDMLVVFVEHGGFPIPAIDADAGIPDLSAWRLRATRFGWLAAVPRRRSGIERAVWIVAACLPLAIAPAIASAEPPAKPTPVKPAPVKPEPTKAPTLPPFEQATSAAEPSEEGSEQEVVEPVIDEPAEPAAAELPAATAGGDVSVIDAAWEGVVGYDVELSLEGGRSIKGRVTALQPTTFTLIDRESGVVRVLQKSSVRQLRVRVPSRMPSQDGTGLLAGGGVLTAVGGPVFLSGVVFLAICPSCTYIHLPMLIVGGGALGGGIAMLVKGARRRREYLDARERSWTIAPVAGGTRTAWTGGLRLRF